ncbi:MAG: hypothetical protein JNM80_02925 [Phycisphaerae bacterium]|nr:hypothetical protein [Phycisphaerae bacterium]
MFATANLTLLALGWGIIATWWVGLPLGLLLAVSARAGRRPRLAPRQLVRPLASTMLTVAGIAAAVGFAGYFATRGLVLPDPAFDRLPEQRHGLLATCWLIHNASYRGGAIAGVALSISTWRRRGRTPAV